MIPTGATCKEGFMVGRRAQQWRWAEGHNNDAYGARTSSATMNSMDGGCCAEVRVSPAHTGATNTMVLIIIAPWVLIGVAPKCDPVPDRARAVARSGSYES